MSNNTPDPKNSSLRLAFQVGSEFISGIIVGLIFGYGIDHFFHTKPWGMVVMILLGTAAGFRNIYRLVQRDMSGLKSGNPNDKETIND